ncbi:MAG: hypothetical protein ACOXZK_05750 [Bacteroidales bacterium]
MTPIEPYIYLLISLLGVAYPIILNAITNIHNKYSSKIILDTFKKEKSFIWFRRLMIISIIVLIIWTLKTPNILLTPYQPINFILNNSASILLALSVIATIFCFIILVDKTITYSSPFDLVKSISNENEPKLANFFSTKLDDKTSFTIAAEVLLSSIKNDGGIMDEEVSSYLYKRYDAFRKGEKGKSPLVYPNYYYEYHYKILNHLTTNNADAPITKHRIGSGMWLLGEAIQKNEISEDTYIWLWRNVVLSIKNNKVSYIVDFIEYSHQYYRINFSGNYNRNDEGKRFLEFIYVMGGLLLSEKQYSLISHLLNYTQTTPPSNKLLPENLSELYGFFANFNTNNDIDKKFYFPNTSLYETEKTVKHWTNKFLGVLFLWQYYKYTGIRTSIHKQFNKFPNNIEDYFLWEKYLETFTHTIDRLLYDDYLIDNLRLKNHIKESKSEFIDKLFPDLYLLVRWE